MKPANLTVLELFQKQQRYVVPLFQRQYIWSKEKQWEPLWEDILFKANQILEQRLGQHRNINNHFLGAIVFSPIKTAGLQTWAKSIIDGQQRLTTLQIILIALRDYAKTVNYGDMQTLALHTQNFGRIETENEKYKVWPTRSDQEVFENIFNAGSYAAVEEKFPLVYQQRRRVPDPLPTLVDAYKYFYQVIREFMENDIDNGVPWPEDIEEPTIEEKIDALLNSFKNHLEIVTIDLDETDNPQAIFETLNFRGEPLKPSDLIRNFIFLEANQKKLNTDHLYNQYWYEFDRPERNGAIGFWKKEESIGRNKIQHLDLFIFHYLNCVKENEILLTRTFPEFKEWWQENDPDFETQLKKLVDYSEIFKTFYNPDLKTRIGIFEKRMKTMEYSTVYPLLLYLMGERTDLKTADITKWIEILESYLVRRIVCNLTSKGYNNIFRVVLDDLRKLERPDDTELTKLLLKLNKDSNRWPNDQEFENAWLSKNAYQRRGAGMILEALDLQMMTSKQESIHISSKLTIEHILPRGWIKENYPFLDLEEGQTPDSRWIYRTSMLQTYGNLTLLTSSLNSSVSNGPFNKKRPEIAGQSLLKMNSYFQDYGDSWNEEDILKRGKALFKVAKTIWPYPTTD